jgi:hypothetical protein
MSIKPRIKLKKPRTRSVVWALLAIGAVIFGQDKLLAVINAIEAFDALPNMEASEL